jgi:hypothetical protein
MELITTIPYDEVDFNFISSHYDIHLHGTCIYKSDLCVFYTHREYDDDMDDFIDTVSIYKLTFIEKLRWELKQYMFELCVGPHWSYINGKPKGKYGTREPKWLYELLFKMYYSSKKYK